MVPLRSHGWSWSPSVLVMVAGIALIASTWSHAKIQIKDGIVYFRCVQNGTVALTFDDGPDIKNNATAKVLDVLKLYDVRATFFVNRVNPAARDLLRRTVAEGHTIGSHAWEHEQLTTIDDAAIVRHMNRLKSQLYEILGQNVTIMRPPYGSYTQNVLDLVNGRLGYKVIIWSFSSEDYRRPGNTRASLRRYKKQLDGVDPAIPWHIVLHHDGLRGAAKLAAAAIEYTRGAGFQFVGLEECLGS